MCVELTSAGGAAEGGGPSAAGRAISGGRTRVASIAGALGACPGEGHRPGGVAGGGITRTGDVHTQG